MTPVLMRPVRNIAPNIVYSARGDEVTDVIVNGSFVVRDKSVLTMDEEKAMDEAQRAATEIADQATEDYMKADSALAKAVKRSLL